MAKGYVKIHRELMDDPLWTSEKYTRGQAWLHLIMLANSNPGYVRKRGTRINLSRGSVGYSLKELSRIFNWSESKTRRFRDELESDGKITFDKTNVSCTITLVNYDFWQGNDWQTRRINERTNGAQMNAQTTRKWYPNNKEKKKNRKKENNTKLFCLNDCEWIEVDSTKLLSDNFCSKYEEELIEKYEYIHTLGREPSFN